MNIRALTTILTILLLLLQTAVAQNLNELNEAITQLGRELAPDKRTSIFDFSLEQGGVPAAVILKGTSDKPMYKNRVITLLEGKGLQVTDSVKLLPDAVFGADTMALATLSVANIRTRPSHAAEMATQAIMGTPLRLLEYSDGFYHIQTPDGYLGWIDGSGLHKLTQQAYRDWKSSDRHFVAALVGWAYQKPDNRSPIVTDLVLGSIVELAESKKGYSRIVLPDGRTGWVESKMLTSWQEWTGKAPDGQEAVQTAKKLMGLPYLWGGTSAKGVDCSGMVKTAWFAQGVILARDASQQARYGGHPDAGDWHNLQWGDLLFFGRSADRVTHVGMYMDQGDYIHASGKVKVNSIAPGREGYNINDIKSLVGTSRITGYLNTSGITLIRNHPWYMASDKLSISNTREKP